MLYNWKEYVFVRKLRNHRRLELNEKYDEYSYSSSLLDKIR